jgi:YgiT-type zinc finger domain-containing protein
MKAFDKCPVCGGELIEKEVEKLLRGGDNFATMKVRADVCSHCGERLYSRKTIHLFETIQTKLEKRETSEFKPLGQSFLVQN